MNENFIDGKKSKDSKPGIIHKRLGKKKGEKLTKADADKLIAKGRKMGGARGKKIAGQGQFIKNMIHNEEVAANSVAGGGVDMAPNAKRQRQVMVRRFKDYIRKDEK